MQVQGLEVRLGEATPRLLLVREAHRHGRSEDDQTLVKADDVHFMEPHQRPIQTLPVILHLAVHKQVGLSNGPQQLAHGGFRQQVHAAAPRRQAADQVVQQTVGPVSAPVCRLRQRRPFTPQGYLHRLHIPFAHRPTAPCTVLAPSVVGDAPNNAPEPFRQRIGEIPIPQDLGSHA